MTIAKADKDKNFDSLEITLAYPFRHTFFQFVTLSCAFYIYFYIKNPIVYVIP